MNQIDAVILRRLYDRPSWIRSLKHVKPRVDKLVEAGLLERIKPPFGSTRNMVQITAKGIDAIELHWRRV